MALPSASKTTVRDRYRLCVRVDARTHIHDVTYASFEAAQARVADIVRRHAQRGIVTQVTLECFESRACSLEQRGWSGAPSVTPSHPSRPWHIRKCWGPDVVRRILEQNDAQRRCPGPAPQFRVDNPLPPDDVGPGGDGQPDTAVRRGSAPAAGSERLRTSHRPTRWNIAGAAAIALCMTAGLILLVAGGRPQEFLKLCTFSRPALCTELPFDARAFNPGPSDQPDEPARPARPDRERPASSMPPRYRAAGTPPPVGG
jgi:hypothetical protein